MDNTSPIGSATAWVWTATSRRGWSKATRSSSSRATSSRLSRGSTCPACGAFASRTTTCARRTAGSCCPVARPQSELLSKRSTTELRHDASDALEHIVHRRGVRDPDPLRRAKGRPRNDGDVSRVEELARECGPWFGGVSALRHANEKVERAARLDEVDARRAEQRRRGVSPPPELSDHLRDRRLRLLA